MKRRTLQFVLFAATVLGTESKQAVDDETDHKKHRWTRSLDAITRHGHSGTPEERQRESNVFKRSAAAPVPQKNVVAPDGAPIAAPVFAPISAPSAVAPVAAPAAGPSGES